MLQQLKVVMKNFEKFVNTKCLIQSQYINKNLDK